MKQRVVKKKYTRLISELGTNGQEMLLCLLRFQPKYLQPTE